MTGLLNCKGCRLHDTHLFQPRQYTLSCRVRTWRGTLCAVAESAAAIEWNSPLRLREGGEGKSNVIALGKFDALHIGHRSLAVQAAAGGAQAWLTTFSGMSEVLGWPPRLPLVAPQDRPRVLLSWAPMCEGTAPQTLQIPFTAVRSMSPAEFVRLLARDLQVAGVVVGTGYRFGYKAQGDTDILAELGQSYGLDIHVVPLVTLSDGQRVSSSRVRELLSAGHMEPICELLGRRYRLVGTGQLCQDGTLWIPREAYCNLPPLEQEYEASVSLGSPLQVLQEAAEEHATRVVVTPSGMRLSLTDSLPPMELDIPQLLNVDFVC